MSTQKQTREFCQKEMTELQQANPNDQFRVSFCKEAKEFVTQIREPDGSWLCLHNDCK